MKRGKIEDACATVPELRRTLELQLEQLAAGLRRAVLFPRLFNGKVMSLPRAHGIEAVETEDGLFYYDPSRITAAEIIDAAEAGTLNNVLMMGPFSKADILQRVRDGELPLAVTECTPHGIEVKTAWGTHVTAPVQVKAMEASKTPGNAVFITSPDHILLLRLKGIDLQACSQDHSAQLMGAL